MGIFSGTRLTTKEPTVLPRLWSSVLPLDYTCVKQVTWNLDIRDILSDLYQLASVVELLTITLAEIWRERCIVVSGLLSKGMIEIQKKMARS